SRTSKTVGRADYDDERPQRRPAERRSDRPSKKSQQGKNMLPILLGVGAAVLVLGGLVIGGVVFAVLRMSTSSTAQTGSSAIAVDEPPPGPAAPARLPVERLKEEEVAIPDGPAPNEMAADVVKKVKQSTTYLRVTLPGGEIAQGSGFFALERNLVITNAHVVGLLRSSTPPRRVEVVVRSGEANEAK